MCLTYGRGLFEKSDNQRLSLAIESNDFSKEGEDSKISPLKKTMKRERRYKRMKTMTIEMTKIRMKTSTAMCMCMCCCQMTKFKLYSVSYGLYL